MTGKIESNFNLYCLLHDKTRDQPANPAILGPGATQSLTYQQLGKLIDAAGDRLMEAGIQPGDCVGLHYASGAEYIILNYAVWRCGACVVPIPLELSAPEKKQILQEIAIGYVITRPTQASAFEACRRGSDTMISAEVTVFPTAMRHPHPVDFHSINPAFIRFTSGTTAHAKGVVLSHESIYQRICAANERLQIGPDDRITWLLSMSYHFTVSVVAYLTFGATIVLPSNHFAPAILEATNRHRSTLIYGSPLHYVWLADAAAEASLRSLRLAISTTTALEPRIADSFFARYGLPLTQALGIIEVGLPCINFDFAQDHPEGVGRVLPAYELRLRDAGFGARLGEIQFRGPGLLDAYYNPWQRRESIMPDGWFRTGDVGELDRNGCLFIRGRAKDVIDVGGMKIFPQEIEAVLKSHPAVADACVYAGKDPRVGELPHARLVLRSCHHLTESELVHYCSRHLAAFKVPRSFQFVESLEQTASGKTIHRPLVQQLRK